MARDPETGRLGVAVQSHWFSVGSVVPWARSGVGAVATQSLADVRYGPLGLELMGAGRTAPEALRALLAGDDGAPVRQVAMIDASGGVAVHTGERCIAEAGHVSGETEDGFVYACQANLMRSPGVPEAMADAFGASRGDLAERMMAALDAAERAGGDIRGRQSAAMLVVEGGGPTTRAPWGERVVDIRVEDHAEPLAELRRLLRVSRAYQLMNEGDLALERGAVDDALRAYAAAERLAGDNPEPMFWTGVSLVNAGRVDEGARRLARVYAADDSWRETLRRLGPSGLLDADDELIERLAGLPAPTDPSEGADE